ncbi:MAG TPA: hypothetical protein VK190_03555 [Pseudoneobacillus sp.]|nr:hypothetical protein [Pseudoneobacillus sp.]
MGITATIHTRLINLGLTSRTVILPEGVRVFQEVDHEEFKRIIAKSRPSAEATIGEIKILLTMLEG